MAAFFEQVSDDRFVAGEHTEGPWAPGAQHGGPPAALLGRAIEAIGSNPDWLTARITVEILGPIPVGELIVKAERVRPGRSVELLAAEMIAGDRPVARASGWRIRTAEGVVPATDLDPPPSLPAVESHVPWPGGYLKAIEWRYEAGAAGDPGPTTVWARTRLPLVTGEPISPLQRVLLVADSGNGVSTELPIDEFWFINPELTVHLHRPPDGEWIRLVARTTLAGNGVGLADSELSDRHGRIGRGAQSLMAGPRNT